MEVTLSDVEFKRVYEYMKLTITGIDHDWYIDKVWNYGVNVREKRGEIQIVLRRKKGISDD